MEYSLTHTLNMVPTLNGVKLWIITYHAVIAIMIFPVLLTLYDLWIVLFGATGVKKQDRAVTAAQSSGIRTVSSPKS